MTSRPTQERIKSASHKKRRHEDENDNDSPNISKTYTSTTQNNNKKHKDKSSKKQAKAELLTKIPTHDPEGIPYSKIQLRRMKRRVKNGLNPIPTEEEEREIERRKEEEKREVDACLFGNDVEAEETNRYDEDGDANQNEDGTDEEDEDSVNNRQEELHPTNDASEKTATNTNEQHQSQPPSKKTKRSKPVPPDYICQACQNKPSDNTEFTPHWIYDCPLKVTHRGCNAIAKRLRGLHDPPSRKVFVSGLPFDVTEGSVKRFFEENVSNGEDTEVIHVKLIKFEDSQRCKGQGILTFDSDEGAKAALKLNGCIWSAADASIIDKKKKGKETEKKKDGKQLRLKISKVLNRFVTKQKK
ncbi:hypothetical protein ACHAW6_015940 [Cyclotella cf. meneghiniana]